LLLLPRFFPFLIYFSPPLANRRYILIVFSNVLRCSLFFYLIVESLPNFFALKVFATIFFFCAFFSMCGSKPWSIHPTPGFSTQNVSLAF